MGEYYIYIVSSFLLTFVLLFVVLLVVLYKRYQIDIKILEKSRRERYENKKKNKENI